MTAASAVEHAIVVDDDPVIRAILRSTLAGIGLGVHLAEGGTQALDVAGRVKADLIVLDLLMPEMNGLETCRHLRRMESYAATPIVVLTGHDHAQVEEAAFAAGANMFLVKPFRPASLLRALAPLLSGRPPSHSVQSLQTGRSELWGEADPEYRNQLWGRLDARRTAIGLILDIPNLRIEGLGIDEPDADA
jgi:CheY-like chemotaxis protein